MSMLITGGESMYKLFLLLKEFFERTQGALLEFIM